MVQYRQFWDQRLDRLEDHLRELQQAKEKKSSRRKWGRVPVGRSASRHRLSHCAEASHTSAHHTGGNHVQDHRHHRQPRAAALGHAYAVVKRHGPQVHLAARQHRAGGPICVGNSSSPWLVEVRAGGPPGGRAAVTQRSGSHRLRALRKCSRTAMGLAGRHCRSAT